MGDVGDMTIDECVEARKEVCTDVNWKYRKWKKNMNSLIFNPFAGTRRQNDVISDLNTEIFDFLEGS